MLLWHVGATIALVRYAFRDERMDLRFLTLGAVLPTLIDLPIGLVWFDRLRSVHLVAHSLLFAAAVMVAVLALTRRGRPRKRWMPVAVGVLVHLLLDGMWAEPETLWWPFLGWSFTPVDAPTVSQWLRDLLTDPVTWGLEAVGAAYLVSLWIRGGLGSREARRRLLATGVVDVPIERR